MPRTISNLRAARASAASGPGWWSRFWPRPPLSLWSSALYRTYAAQSSSEALKTPPAVLRGAAELIAAHPDDPAVHLHGLNGVLWLLDAARTDFEATALRAAEAAAGAETEGSAAARGGASEQAGPIDAGPLLRVAVRGLSAFRKSGEPERTGVAAAACWLLRDLTGSDNPRGFIALPPWADGDGPSGGEGGGEVQEHSPVLIAEALIAALTGFSESAEVAGAACQALSSLLRVDWRALPCGMQTTPHPSKRQRGSFPLPNFSAVPRWHLSSPHAVPLAGQRQERSPLARRWRRPRPASPAAQRWLRRSSPPLR